MTSFLARRRLGATLLALAGVLVSPVPGWADIDYRDWSEGALAMLAQTFLYEEVKLYTVGDVSDPSAMQLAMRISENADVEDPGDKNVVLIECGMHAREWFAAESCYWFIDWLLEYRNTADVRDLLEHVDLWVLPQTNPAGRNQDDLAGGDPTRFVRYCESGSDVGSSCASHADCRGGGACAASGWRTNVNLTSCPIGVDLARNFSSGWDDAQGFCDASPLYRGPDPFSELEALNLRRFVHNHMISMALVVHANSQEISNQWYDSNQASRFMTDELVAMNAAASADYVSRGYPDPAMAKTGVGGGGYGQFSSWLTRASNVLAELDEGTTRNISTFFFEVPVNSDNYEPPYQHRSGDGSNSFHPSARRMKGLWRAALRDLFVYVTRQGRSPQCPVDHRGAFILAPCQNDDFGLVGAKIAPATDEPGVLDYDPVTREERLRAGTHSIVFAVQNFSVGGGTSTNATIVVRKDGVVDATHTEPISLTMGERGTFSWDYTFVDGSEYRVEIELDPDGFGANGGKIFAFRTTPGIARIAPYLGIARVRLQRRQTEDRFTWRGRFVLDGPVNPEIGAALTVHGHVRQDIPQPVPPFTAILGMGPPFWDKSKQEKGRWNYKDKDGFYGPVQYLKIRQKEDKKTGEWKTKVALKVRRTQLGELIDAGSLRADLELFGDGLVLTSIARRSTGNVAPFKTPPDDETEKEPQGQP